MRYIKVITLAVTAAGTLAACSGGAKTGMSSGGSGTAPPPAAANTAPTVSNLSTSQAVLQDAVSDPIPFTVGDTETAPAALTVAVTSSNPDLISADNVDIGGDGSSRNLVLRPQPGLSGSADLTVTATDAGGMTSSQKMTLNVTTQDASFRNFVTTAIAAADTSEPKEVLGKTWSDFATEDPAAFDSIVQ